MANNAATKVQKTSIAIHAPWSACLFVRLGMRNQTISAPIFDTPAYFIHGSVGSRL